MKKYFFYDVCLHILLYLASAPAASAVNFIKISNTLNTIESNATIKLNVETFHQIKKIPGFVHIS